MSIPITCQRCGQQNQPTAQLCARCGTSLVPPMQYQPPPPLAPADVSGKKLAAGICGILLGNLGIHKFVLGLTTEGVIMLVITLATCGIGGLVTGVIGIIEGIIYLTKSDVEFYQTYIVGRKGWF